jgi:dipeptidyl aminopeptidase/acylaminoacyl peptidase
MRTNQPYGFWQSSITADLLTSQTLRLSEPQADGKEVFWLETRPNEKGRNALVQGFNNGEQKDLLPEPHSIRSRVHEYGGGSYLVTPTRIFCVLDEDQRIYQIDRSTHVLSVLSPPGPSRYADFHWDDVRQSLLCVREDHSLIEKIDSVEKHPRNEIVSIDLNGNIKVLISGADFYSNPHLDPTGTKLSYLCWNHPQMPWDGTECFCASMDKSGTVLKKTLIAGSKNESIFQPQWSPKGDLYFVSDRNNWWNIYRHNFLSSSTEIISDMAAEFATPQWVFGMSTYGFLNSDQLFCCFSQHGQWHLATIDIRSKHLQIIKTEFTDISAIFCNQGKGYCIAASAKSASELLRFENNKFTSLTKSSATTIADNEISLPEAITFNTSDQETAHAFYYPPKNATIDGLKDSLPPLIIICHGGPTGATETSLNIKIQFWTNRGFAVLDINYRGSTGYGRQYRDRLKQNWGITDVIDVCSGANYMIKKGLVDPHKIAIRGSSAGGYTVLAALTFSDRFNAGASLYGIGDLEALAQDTHKFESRYLDTLVGEYPKQKLIYQQRSPINHIDQLNCPVIFLQGLKDKVVPPNQAEAMASALNHKGIKNLLITFADEGHGFRQAQNIKNAIESELAFYQSLFIDDKVIDKKNINTKGAL